MRGARRIATLLCVGSLFVGCGSKRAGFISDATKVDSGSSGANSTDGSVVGAPSIPDDGINAAIGSGGVPQINESCLSEVREAERVDVDLFIMLDRSSSMNASIQNGSTKWDAITSALASFAADPGTADIGIGLQYFPQHNLAVPTECREDVDCGDNGPCLITGSCFSHLLEAGSECYSKANCPLPGDRCATVGLCADNQDFACSPAGSTCQDDQGHNFGACVRWAGHCAQQDSCDPSVYGVPQIPIMVGADRGQLFTDSIASHAPLGDTPTAPALQGAIDYAHTWAEDHPTHVVVVVLATDGLPSECSAADDTGTLIEPIAAIAQSAAEGAPAIRTFVIGVFSSGDAAAPGNLDTIAKAGATGSAFVIDIAGDVLSDFFTALDSIRTTALACDFKLANQTNENSLNYELVNLSFDNGHDKPTQLINVKDSAGCADRDHDGWYYVTEAGSQTPTQISVCPGVCDDFKSTNGGSVKLQIGCQTIVR